METMKTIETNKLVAQNLTKTFCQGKQQLHVLRNVNLTFAKGESYAIKGASGSGKSTLLHLLGSLDEPTSGNVLFCGQYLFKISAKKREIILNQKIGFVFQFHYLIHELTVLENITLPGKIANEKNSSLIARGKELLELVGLSDKASSYPSELSGGEQQRISILRAIFNKPDFLLADEPTGNLDEENAKKITDLLLRFQKEWGMGVIICSHDRTVYEKMESLFELHDGQIKE